MPESIKRDGTSSQWRRNEINIAGARRGPKDGNSKPELLSQGLRVLGEGLNAPPH